MHDLARILFAAVMGVSVTAALLVVTTIARGAAGAALPAVTAAMLLTWLAVAVAAATGGLVHVAVAPAMVAAVSLLWLGVPPVRRGWGGASMAALVGLQVLRVFGGARILGERGGWLPRPYGTLLGAVDVALAVVGVLLARAWSRDSASVRRATAGWAAFALGATGVGLVYQGRMVRPMPGFEALWSAFLTPLLAALLVVTLYRSVRRAG